MRYTLIEQLRKESVLDLFNDKDTESWDVWYSNITKFFNPQKPTYESLLSLGDHLADVFRATNNCEGESRSQSNLSKGGTYWEKLVTWYINICSVGSRVVAFRGNKKTRVPSVISQALTVEYRNLECQSESDIIVLVFPRTHPFVDPKDLQLFLKKKGDIDFNVLSNEIGKQFYSFQIGVIQCKTNWNDNAQAPMLWDLIYKSKKKAIDGITVGSALYSIQNIPFTYSFVTVPTNELDNFSPSSICVARVTHLSGGNYWGHESKNGIALSLSKIFSRNYRQGYTDCDINIDLKREINELVANYPYFWKGNKKQNTHK